MPSRLMLFALLAGALALLALAGPASSGAPHALLGPAGAAAAQCKGGAKAPKRLSKKRAASLVACLVNKKRRKAGRRTMKRHDRLRKAARSHTRYMKRSDCFAHTCPGETSLGGRLHRSRYLPCNCAWGAGETIGYGRNRRGSPRKIVRAWMQSGSHRSRLLNGGYEHVGVGMARGTPYEGTKKAATYTLDLGYKR